MRSGFVELLKRNLGGDLTAVYECLMGGCREGRARLSCSQTGLTEIGWQVTGQVGTQEIAIRCKEKYFTLRVVKYWNRLLKVAVVFLSLEILKTQLHRDLSNLIWLDLIGAGDWIRWPPEVLRNLSYSVIPQKEIFTVCTELPLPFGFPDDRIKWDLFRLWN